MGQRSGRLSVAPDGDQPVAATTNLWHHINAGARTCGDQPVATHLWRRTLTAMRTSGDHLTRTFLHTFAFRYVPPRRLAVEGRGAADCGPGNGKDFVTSSILRHAPTYYCDEQALRRRGVLGADRRAADADATHPARDSSRGAECARRKENTSFVPFAPTVSSVGSTCRRQISADTNQLASLSHHEHILFLLRSLPI